MTFEIPGINKKNVSDLYEDDLDIYLPVLRAYVDETPAALKRLCNVSADTLPEYIRVIHGVKGTSASACAEEARKQALNLETFAKAGDLAGVLAHNAGFLGYMDNLVAGIQSWFLENSK